MKSFKVSSCEACPFHRWDNGAVMATGMLFCNFPGKDFCISMEREEFPPSKCALHCGGGAAFYVCAEKEER